MEGAQVPTQQVVHVQLAPMLNAKSSGLAIVLAFLWPGLDYFYLEDGSGGVKRAIGYAFLMFTIIGIPVALIIWIMGIASSSRRTAEFNNNLMMQNQGPTPNQQIVQQ
jgi:TM2 domain-containing membrane protein YozV